MTEKTADQWTAEDWAELMAEGNKSMTKQKFVDVMRTLYQVWDGTENADDILEDVCNTFASDIFDLKPGSEERRSFMQRCQWGVIRNE